MNTVIIVWVMLASVATSSQNRASFMVDNIATVEDCNNMLSNLREVWTLGDIRGRCIQYHKVVSK